MIALPLGILALGPRSGPAKGSIAACGIGVNGGYTLRKMRLRSSSFGTFWGNQRSTTQPVHELGVRSRDTLRDPAGYPQPSTHSRTTQPASTERLAIFARHLFHTAPAYYS